ncbi:MAG: hypothetical protein KIT72_03390 [Polyangiaceae bacterium]|nr:hypothetical protein [Polyangiaceae bacterium]MCW5789444.1 hypothetical protein [Polyangiaceae bacterium]
MAESSSWKLKAAGWALGGAVLGVTLTRMCTPDGTVGQPLSAPLSDTTTSVAPLESVRGSSIELRVEDTSGRALPVYPHRGEQVVLGRAGDRYALRVFNRSGRRVEVLPTVDGRSVITGQPGDFEQRGYIIAAYDSIVIDGFRDSQDTTRAFRFSTPERSYSALRGTPQHVGVIGLAVFEERLPRFSRHAPLGQRDDLQRAPGSAAAPAQPRAKEGNLGTGWGEQQWSPTSRTRFERAARAPAEVLSLRYDDQEGLRARGIRPAPTWAPGFAEPPSDEPNPNPFPGQPVSRR